MLTRCKAFLKHYFPVDSITMGCFDFEKRMIYHISQATDNKVVTLGDRVQVPSHVATLLESEKETHTVTVINTPEDNPSMYQWWKSLGQIDGSFMSIPLSLDNEYIGFVGIFSKDRAQYQEEHANLFSMLSAPFAIALNNVLQHRELIRLQAFLKDDNRYLKKELQKQFTQEIIGAEGGLRRVMKKVRQVSPMGSQVLLLGETGVGKEVIANAIHYASPRADGPFIKVNCGAIPENLIDAELFGYEKGAFTGAIKQKRGRFERAHQGTLFLDEIGELALTAQVRLLRVLQNREIERVGGTEPISVDVRIIAATNRDLEQMVCQGTFREDLWFRLNVFPIVIPPLRKRHEDIPDLVRFLIRKIAKQMNVDYIPEPAPGFIEAMQKKEWRGNIRQLANTIERLMIGHIGMPPGYLLQADNLTDAVESPTYTLPAQNQDTPELRKLDAVMADHIRFVMTHTRGRIQGKEGAAAILGMNPSTLRSRMKKLRIPFGRDESY